MAKPSAHLMVTRCRCYALKLGLALPAQSHGIPEMVWLTYCSQLWNGMQLDLESLKTRSSNFKMAALTLPLFIFMHAFHQGVQS